MDGINNYQNFNNNRNNMQNIQNFSNNQNNINNINNMNSNYNQNNNFNLYNNNNYNSKFMPNNNMNNNMNNSINNNMNSYQNINNNINNQNQNSFKNEFFELLQRAENCLRDENNVNHYLYIKYCSNQNNNQNNNHNIVYTSSTEPTSDPNFNKVTTFSISSSYEEEYVKFDKIISVEEKRTAVKITGTNFPYKGGDAIVEILENIGSNKGKRLYDIIYVPKKKENSNDKYFMVNFKESIYIKNFYDGLYNILDQKEKKEMKFIWFKKQGDEMKKSMKKKQQNKKNKCYIKIIE